MTKLKDEDSKIMEIIPEIIDNRLPKSVLPYDKEFKDIYRMDQVLNVILEKTNPSIVKICTGYFSPHVWKLVGSNLNLIEERENELTLQILIGSETEGRNTNDFQKWFNEQIHKELESLDLDFSLQTHIISLIKFLDRDDIQVALQSAPFVHSKLFLFPYIALVGSSNFTINGLTRNTELNVPIYDSAQISGLNDWYDNIISRADSTYKEKLIEALKNCKLGTKEWTPYEAYLKILYEAYKPTLFLDDIEASISLALFQKEGVKRILKAIHNFGGAMLADSVGLGKSYQALEVVRQLQATGKRRTLLLCPAQLRNQWEKLVDSINVWVDVYSMERLATKLPSKRRIYDIIVIDESHNFRNRNTKRYKNLQNLLVRNSQAKVLLVTATPINTSLRDLLTQIRIITRNVDSYEPFHNIGVYDLHEYFKAVENRKEDIARFRDQVIISRSRREIKLRQKFFKVDLEIDGVPLRFPDRNLGTINYSITDSNISELSSSEFYSNVVDVLDNLEFPYYNIEKYNLSIELDHAAKALGVMLSALMKVMLLKRMESSLVAFEKSICSQIHLNNLFEEVINQGVLIKATVIRKLFDEAVAESEDIGEDAIEVFKEIIEALKIETELKEEDLEKEENYDLLKIKEDINSSRKSLENLLEQIEQIKKHEDKKAYELFELLLEKRSKKILIFSYFKDTLKHIHELFTTKYPQLASKVGIISGETPDYERNRLVKRFAPISNKDFEDEKEIDKEDELEILFSTDVLSEGQNLQDAAICINYDLHWNPVRLIQRIGRIDRLKSPHKDIWVYNFFPEEGLEALLSLVERLVKRLATINETLELDGAVLNGEELDRKKVQIGKLQHEDIAVLDELEAEIELMVDSKSRDLLLHELLQKGEGFFKNIPIGVHSGMKTENQSGVAVAVRVYRGGIPSILWGYEPDDIELYNDYLVNGVVPNATYVERIMVCNQETPRFLVENENMDGALFKRVLGIAKKLREIYGAKHITRKLSQKVPRGNQQILIAIRRAQGLARRRLMKFPETDRNYKFLKTYPISSIITEIGNISTELQNDYKDFQQAHKTASYKEKKAVEKDFVEQASSFVREFDSYIVKNKLLEDEEEKAEIEKMKFELLGFMRLYK